MTRRPAPRPDVPAALAKQAAPPSPAIDWTQPGAKTIGSRWGIAVLDACDAIEVGVERVEWTGKPTFWWVKAREPRGTLVRRTSRISLRAAARKVCEAMARVVPCAACDGTGDDVGADGFACVSCNGFGIARREPPAPEDPDDE